MQTLIRTRQRILTLPTLEVPSIIKVMWTIKVVELVKHQQPLISWVKCGHKKVSLGLNLCYYNSHMLSVLLHGCETQHLKASQEKKIEAFDFV